jgi:hypothetical protein
LDGGKEIIRMYGDDASQLEYMADMKRSLEEAEILRSGMKLVLMDPLLDSVRRDEYEKTFAKLSSEIRDLKTMMVNVRKRTHSSEPRERIT